MNTGKLWQAVVQQMEQINEPGREPRETARPFRFTFSLLYISIAGAIAYLNGLTQCNTGYFFSGNAEIGVALLLLLGLEWFEQNRFRNKPPTGVAIVLLGTRMLLIEGMVNLDCTGVALYLYPMIPFSAHFSLPSRYSLGLSLFYILLNIWRTTQGTPEWFLDPELTSSMLAFALVMMFVPLVAQVIRRDDESRQRTEDLLEDLEISHMKLQAYAEQVAELAATEERNRLARDIHDSLGHYLTAVNIQLEKAIVYLERNPQEATQAIRDAKLSSEEALRDVRRSVQALRDPEHPFSLRAELDRLIRGVDRHNLEVTYKFEGNERDYNHASLMALYRAAQEGLTNVQKHSRATQVHVNVRLGPQTGLLVIKDDGEGFAQDNLENTDRHLNAGYGLRGLRERLELVRGRLLIHSQPGEGSEIIVTVPKNPLLLIANE